MNRLDVQRLATAVVAAACMAAGAVTVAGQQPRLEPAIPSLTEPGHGLDVRARSADGRVTFASRAGRGVLLRGLPGAPAADRALAFVDGYGEPFGLRARTDVRVMGMATADALGQEHVRLQQLHDGVPVTAGELIVHLAGDRVVAVNGHTLSDLPPLLAPSQTPVMAVEAAQALIVKHRAEQAPTAQYAEPRLEVFNRGMIDQGTWPTRLAWFVEATGEQLREFIWIDARSGAVLLNFSQLAEAKNRTVYDVAMGTSLPGTLARSEGGPPSAVLDVNQAYDFAGQTYDYFFTNYGRDSFDNAGAEIRSSVRYRHPSAPGSPYQNAFWNGSQMVYGEGFAAADDVVAHELGHAVTDRSASLLYYYQSGALNESFSDIFGEAMDLTTGLTAGDLPAQRWLLGEDLSIGAIRNMTNPNAFGDPGKMSDAQFFCRSDGWTGPNSDSGGVHINSGVPNHAFALMVDGGTYNGRTVTGIGLAKAGLVQYRVLTTYLTSGSNFSDNATALNQSCTDLVGVGGITANDCTQVATAVLAVEMSNPWPCAGATPPPATYCPLGGNAAPFFSDGFESGSANWSMSSTTTENWGVIVDFAKTGVRSAYGEDIQFSSDHRMAMTNAVLVPANARMSFDHAFEFEHFQTSFYYDGAVLEYSTNGTTWNDAGALIDAGQAYNGTLEAVNPLGARSAFVRSSFGYSASRLNLAALAGQSVRFRFRVGTDETVGSLGWVVDNVRLYTCITTTSPPTTVNDAYSTAFQTPLNIAAPGLLANDNSNGGGVMTASLDTNPASGSLILSADGGFSYTPNAGFSGTDSFTYHAVNPNGPGNIATVTITVSAVPTTPQAPTALYAASVVGNTLTLRWTPPASGPAPTGYILEGGVSPGEVLASIPTGSAAPIYTIVAPTGSFYVRMYTQTAAGRSAAASNEIRVHVNVPVPPSAPANLLGMVNGSTIALAWKNTFAGGAPSDVLLDVTGTLAATLSVGPGESFQFPAVPNGTYTFSLRAENGAGVSAASNSVTLTFPGPCSGVPQVPANLLTMKSGSTIFVYWDPPAAGPAPTVYVLDVTGAFSGSFATGGRALSGAAGPGTYNLSVRAANSCGNGASTAAQSVTIP